MKIVVVTLAACLISASSWADWAIVGASYKCSKNEFSLAASVESSSGTISAPRQMRPLKIGRNKLSCQIGHAAIKAIVDLSGPGHNGACGDPGTIGIMKFQVNGEDIVEFGEQMLFYCDGQPTILSINVAKSGDAAIAKVCRGLWTWGDSYQEVQCKEKIIGRRAAQMPNTSFHRTLRDEAAQRR